MEDRYTVIPEEEQEVIIQKKIAHWSMKFLEEKYDGQLFANEHISNLYQRLKLDQTVLERGTDEPTGENENTIKDYRLAYLELLDQQRKLLQQMNRKAEFDEDLIRKYLILIDLEELRLRQN